MAVTWAEGEIQATLVAAGSRLPFGGLCMRLQGLWLIPTQRLHRGDHEAPWGHRQRRAPEPSPPGARAVKRAHELGLILCHSLCPEKGFRACDPTEAAQQLRQAETAVVSPTERRRE